VTINAYASLDKWESSSVVTASFIKQPKLEPPVISPSSGSFVGSKHITISTPQSSAQIYYRISGGSSYQLYPSSGITITNTATINAYASLSGWESSSTVTASFTKQFEPTITINTPEAGITLSSTNNIVVTTSVNDSDGTIATVQFKVDDVLRGEINTLPYSYDIGKLNAGNRVICARAIDNDNLWQEDCHTILIEQPSSIIEGTPSDTAPVDQLYLFQPTTSGFNGSTLSFELSNNPAWLQIESNSGKVFGMPKPNDVGESLDIEITASDGENQATLMIPSLVVVDSSQIQEYIYDALGRLVQVIDPQNGNREYTYDEAGNRKEVKEDEQ